jgi:hypothetical protein
MCRHYDELGSLLLRGVDYDLRGVAKTVELILLSTWIPLERSPQAGSSNSAIAHDSWTSASPRGGRSRPGSLPCGHGQPTQCRSYSQQPCVYLPRPRRLRESPTLWAWRCLMTFASDTLPVLILLFALLVLDVVALVWSSDSRMLDPRTRT